MPPARRSSKPADVWTTRSLLTWITGALSKQGIESPRLCAEMLVAHVLGCERMRLYMDPERPAEPLERNKLRELVSRALKHEPIQYLVGEAWFFSMAFHVDPRVLVPRPSTETIVELVLQHARSEPGFERASIADVATGSGCVAIALLKHLPDAHAIATDLSAEALEVAALNASRHHVDDRLDLIRGDLLEPLRDHPAGRELHYLVSNPPYIPDDEWEHVPPNVRREPESALRGGPDGMRFFKPLIEGGPALLRPGGLLAIEIAESKANEAMKAARDQAELADPRIENDFEGRPRVLVARKRD